MSSDGSPSRDDGGRRSFGRKMVVSPDEPERIGGGNYEGPVDEHFMKFLRNLAKERDALDAEQFPHIHRLIQAELDRVARGSYGAMASEPIFVDLYNDPPITLTAKCMPPSRQFPKFNYAGRIIGPKGAYLKSLMKETSAKMVLLGKGVMKDKEKEEELRRSNDPKYLHINEDMHVSIQITAAASEAYKRMAYAISCLKEQVLSDNRTLETLPWIAASAAGGHRGHGPPDMGGGGRPMDSGPRYSQPPRSSGYPPVDSMPRSHHRSAAPQPVYDYGDVESPPVYRRYQGEMSPPPSRRGDGMKPSSPYGDSGQWRSMEGPRGGYDDGRHGSSSHISRSRSPPPRSSSYSSVPYEDTYASYYTSYYPPADDPGYGPPMQPSRGGKISQSRYAPYKK